MQYDTASVKITILSMLTDASSFDVSTKEVMDRAEEMYQWVLEDDEKPTGASVSHLTPVQ